MTLGSHQKEDKRISTLDMSEDEFKSALNGETIKHQTMSRTISGVWEVKFKKNSPRKHNHLIGS